MAKDRRTRDQKRKVQLAKRKQRSRQLASLAYMGRKYQTDELVPIWLETELGIFETFVITDRKLLDHTVAAAIEKLIMQLRTGTLSSPSDDAELECEVGREEDFLIDMIRLRWEEYFDETPRPTTDKLIGVLRSILGSIKRMQSSGFRSQRYLRHISEFLSKKLGVSMTRVPADTLPLPEPKKERRMLLERN